MTPPDPGIPAPSARSARLFEACEGLPAWWRAPLRAGRGAAEALGRAPVDAAQWDGAWNGFREPFLALSAHVDALRNPAPMLSAPLAGSVATEPAEKTSQIGGRMPGAIGSSRGATDASSPGRPGASGPGRSLYRAEAIPPRPLASRSGNNDPDAGPGAKSAKESLAPSPAAAGPSSSVRAALRVSAAAAPGSPRTVNAVEAGMGAWLTRARRALGRMSPSPSGRPAPAGADGAAASAAQAVATDSPGAQAWFGAWIKNLSAIPSVPANAMGTATPAAGSSLLGATGRASSAPAPLGAVAAPAYGTAKAAGPARAPAWTEILEELMPGPGAQAFPSAAGHPAPASDAAPAAPRDPKGRPAAWGEVTSKGLSREDAPSPDARAPMESPRSTASPSLEWLDEEADLAGKLHRLLRRQAKRRGVDLS